MLKVVYLLSTLEATAPVKQLFYIVKYLDRNGFEPFVVTLSPEKERSYKELFLKEGAEVISLERSRVEGAFLNRFLLKRILKKLNPDIVHSQGHRANMLLSGFSEYKRVVTLRANPFKDYAFSYGKITGKFLAERELKAVLSFDRVVCVSKSLADTVYEKSGKKVEYIYNGLDFSLYEEEFDKEELRERLNLPSDKKIFSVVGNLIEGKDPKTVIEAFKLLNRNDFYLVFLGEGELLRECERLSEGRADFRGFVKNVKDYLHASDYLISASLSEGMPNAVLEALSCGLGVVLSDISPHKEIVGGGYFGEIFETKNPSDLKNKILKMLNKDYEKVSYEAKRRVREDFDAKKNSFKYQKLYEEVVKGKK